MGKEDDRERKDKSEIELNNYLNKKYLFWIPPMAAVLAALILHV